MTFLKTRLQNHTTVDKLKCFATLFDALVLLKLHFIIITLVQTNFLQVRERRIGYIYRMENLSP